eukprot:CAMPEP_0176081574 /NCGR_PEP_ID=MMETSP0120_2-20121206/40804_2 /TAXON_ID=160619 /ORGANISM="Kryptoperidinium foliaceum, Strain CCMP 1326" /LENGTH=150 /DNA_ID=CAMNT_0017415341 /DNA_START=117 /DNA_END=570 /DNA_ORIENTATION=-
MKPNRCGGSWLGTLRRCRTCRRRHCDSLAHLRRLLLSLRKRDTEAASCIRDRPAVRSVRVLADAQKDVKSGQAMNLSTSTFVVPSVTAPTSSSSFGQASLQVSRHFVAPSKMASTPKLLDSGQIASAADNITLTTTATAEARGAMTAARE